jgi:ferredoxin
VKKRLKALARWLVEREGGELKVFVDTAPVMEKPLSEAAGIGWRASIPTSSRASTEAGCSSGSSSPASTSSPTSPRATRAEAAPAASTPARPRRSTVPGKIDARKCISYLTIEHSGPIPTEFRRAIGNRIYGCDDCLAVCPWNRFAEAAAANRAFLPREELKAPKLEDLLALDDAAFRALFAGSPIKRIGVERMIRNCLIAAGNSRDPELVPAVASIWHHDPVVAEAARWALDEIQGPSARNAKRLIHVGKRRGARVDIGDPVGRISGRVEIGVENAVALRNCSFRLAPSRICSAGVPNRPTRSSAVRPMISPRVCAEGGISPGTAARGAVAQAATRSDSESDENTAHAIDDAVDACQAQVARWPRCR